jgi:hypothetical protein
MACSEEVNSLMDTVDSIQRRFLESLVTVQRDPMFGESKPGPALSCRPKSATLQTDGIPLTKVTPG